MLLCSEMPLVWERPEIVKQKAGNNRRIWSCRDCNHLKKSVKPTSSGWWQLKDFLFSPLLYTWGKDSQIDEHIFQRG